MAAEPALVSVAAVAGRPQMHPRRLEPRLAHSLTSPRFLSAIAVDMAYLAWLGQLVLVAVQYSLPPLLDVAFQAWHSLSLSTPMTAS